MKIRKIKLENHTVLGTIDFDFTDKYGKVIDNIIIAGENGTGKTVLLNLIYSFCNPALENEKRNEKRFFEIELTDEEITHLYENANLKHYFKEPLSDNIFQLFYDFSITENWEQVKIMIHTQNGEKMIGGDVIVHEAKILRSIFSDAEINYLPNQIRSVTAKDVDTLNFKSEKSSKDLATEITQLLIDIETLDNQDFSNWGKLNVGKPVDESQLNNRMKRFTDAFSYMFPSKKFKHIINRNGHKSLVFEENGNEMPIENLSSGEKQIVFRGSFLLKDKVCNYGAVILIDEPEISMHPKWQKKILKYYKDLFIETGIQKTQLFFATHSEIALKEALSDNSNNLVIILNDISGVIIAKRIDAPTVLPSITYAETNYLAFDIASNDYHIELYGWLQQKESKHNVKSCDDFIKNHRLYNSEIHRKPSFNGSTAYDTLSTFIRNAIDHPAPNRTFTDNELNTSIELLIELCKCRN